MSYATMQDVLFAFDVTDSELRDQPRLHPEEPADEPELPEEPGKLRRAAQPKAAMRRAA
jgi:hypothetical protein